MHEWRRWETKHSVADVQSCHCGSVASFTARAAMKRPAAAISWPYFSTVEYSYLPAYNSVVAM